MFDTAISLDFNETNQEHSFAINRFPHRVTPQLMHKKNAWYDVKAYYHENLSHPWFSVMQNVKMFSMGQILFRADSKYADTPVDKAMERVLEIWKSEQERVTNHIKGNFILFILDEDKKELKIITSKSCQYDLYVAKFDARYYISTSLNSLVSIDDSLKEIDEISLIETGIFDYPLGRRALYKNVKWFDQGCIYSFSQANHKESTYFNWSDALSKYNPKLSWKDTYSEVTSVFNQTLERQLKGKTKIISAITSGFDSRTVLSYLLKAGFKDSLYYSWGKKEHVDVIIPKEIAATFGLNYKFCDFDEDFHKDYLTSSEEAIYFSDARATLRRANHFYYYKVLSEYSHYNFTGLYGSEILRPISTIGHMFNDDFLKIFLNPEKSVIQSVIENEKAKGYYNPAFITQHEDGVIEHISKYIKEVKGDFPNYLALHNFTLNSGLMKYFGHEVHGARAYATTYSPYIDDEFLEFILMTPTMELDRIALELNLKQSFSHTRRGQMLYIPVIKSNCPELMKQKTGRFYNPAQLISPIYPLSVIPALLKKKKYQKRLPLLGSEEWIYKFIANHKYGNDFEPGVFQEMPEYSKANFTEYAKQISLRYWIDKTKSNIH